VTVASKSFLSRFFGASKLDDRAQRAIADRTRVVDQLLEFSQTIQGAGKPEQILAALTHFLRIELNLAGIVIIAQEADSAPAMQVRASWPKDLLSAAHPISEMECAMCPCLRQNLPKCFKPNGSPVRCAVDASLDLSPDHPAFCMPFAIGRKTQMLVHMLLPVAATWTDELKQLAQTYVNAAQSSLVMLHMLQHAEQQSMTDPLTGLYNRRSLEQLLEREVALAERHSHPLSVVMIDMDKFKGISTGTPSAGSTTARTGNR
jgi:hypothetical protein